MLRLIDNPAGSVRATDIGAGITLGDAATSTVALTDAGASLLLGDAP